MCVVRAYYVRMCVMCVNILSCSVLGAEREREIDDRRIDVDARRRAVSLSRSRTAAADGIGGSVAVMVILNNFPPTRHTFSRSPPDLHAPVLGFVMHFPHAHDLINSRHDANDVITQNWTRPNCGCVSVKILYGTTQHQHHPLRETMRSSARAVD